MLDRETASLVKEAITRAIPNIHVTLEIVSKMEPIRTSTLLGDDYTILTLQYGDMSILVWIQMDENGTIVRGVHTSSW